MGRGGADRDEKLRIKIVDLTQEEDIRKMLGSARSDKRISLDLDEVVFGKEGDGYLEKALPFPLNRIYKERVRLGIPALFNALKDAGYDIWIYTARYYSADYLKFCLRHYHAPVTGIVTGTARKGPPGSDTMKELEKRMNAKYDKTVHIDNESVIVTTHGSRDFEEYRLSGSAASWSREALDILTSGKAFRGAGK